MKIGILTFHDTSNFGAMLQTYGLYKCLLQMGHNPEIINYRCEAIIKRETPPSWSFTLNPKEILKQLLIYPNDRKRYNGISAFKNNYIGNISSSVTKATIKNIAKSYDVLMVGSDMVWALNITDEDYTYFLDFANSCETKCTYGSSIGAPWTEKQIEKIEKLLSSFKYVSVREDITANIIKGVSKRDVDVVCDPTMLLDTDTWCELSSDRYRNKEYILVYFNDSEGNCLRKAVEHGKKTGLPVYLLNGYIPKVNSKNINVYTIHDFLSAIRYASFVYTASYHGLLFSLYFQKQFLYFEREPAVRMQYISNRLKIGNRNGGLIGANIEESIDYSLLNERIIDFREYSKSQIRKAIENG